MTYLQPTSPSPPQGQDLNRVIQQWIAGILGAALDSALIRAYDQAEPPVIPDSGTAWMAFQQHAERSDTFPYVKSNPDGTGSTLQRHEILAVLCSFYDLGTNGQASMLASLLRDGASIPDNLETLQLADMGLVGCEPEIAVPSLLKQRWLYRVDLPLKLTRQVTRVYGVPNIVQAVGTISNESIVENIDVHN